MLSSLQWCDSTSVLNPPQVLYLPRDSGYTVFKPLRYGKLNTSSDSTLDASGDSGEGDSTRPSHQAVLSMLEDLWTRAVEEYLQIERKDFKACKGVWFVNEPGTWCVVCYRANIGVWYIYEPGTGRSGGLVYQSPWNVTFTIE